MSIRMSIYDFFSYAVPGGVFMSPFLYLLSKYYDKVFSLSGMSFWGFLIWGSLAYIIGYAIDPLVSKSWYKIFRSENFFQETMEKFNERHTTVNVKFQEMDWYIPLSFIKRHSIEMAYDVEKFNAINIMLRNVSFGLLIYTIIFSIEFFLEDYAWIYAVLAVICLSFSVTLGRQSAKFQKWFYQSIYQTLIALVMKPEYLPVEFVGYDNADKKSRKKE